MKCTRHLAAALALWLAALPALAQQADDPPVGVRDAVAIAQRTAHTVFGDAALTDGDIYFAPDGSVNVYAFVFYSASRHAPITVLTSAWKDDVPVMMMWKGLPKHKDLRVLANARAAIKAETGVAVSAPRWVYWLDCYEVWAEFPEVNPATGLPIIYNLYTGELGSMAELLLKWDNRLANSNLMYQAAEQPGVSSPNPVMQRRIATARNRAAYVSQQWSGVSDFLAAGGSVGAPPPDYGHTSYVAGVPNINQGYNEDCAIASSLDVLLFWDDRGYDKLVDDNDLKTPRTRLRVAMNYDPVGGTSGAMIGPGIQAFCNDAAYGNEYAFDAQTVEAGETPTEAWTDLKAEIDAGRPLVVGIYDYTDDPLNPTDFDYDGHAISGVGYYEGTLFSSASTKWIIIHDNWAPYTPQVATLEYDIIRADSSQVRWYVDPYYIDDEPYIDANRLQTDGVTLSWYLAVIVHPSPAAAAVPSAPWNLVAEPGSSSVALTWEEFSWRESGFKIERKIGDSGSWQQIGTVDADVTTYADSLSSANSYYRVCAYTADGNSAYTNVVFVGQLTTLVNNVAVGPISDSKPNERNYVLSVPSGATQLEFRIYPESGATGDCDLYIKHGSLAGQSSYDYRGALSGNNERVVIESPASGNWYVMLYAYRDYSGVMLKGWYVTQDSTSQAPAAPSGLTASARSASQINLAWSDNATNELGYRIERRLGQVGTWSQIAAVGENAITYQDLGLSSGMTYYYRVRAFTATNLSGYSNQAYATTLSSGGSGVTELQNDVPVSDLAGAKASQTYFKITVPAGAASLNISTSGGSGDCDLYVKYGDLPSPTSYNYRPYKSGNNETVTVLSPAAGDWYIMLRGYSPYSGLTIRATYQTSGGNVPLAPSGLVATALASDKVSLSWTDNSTDESGFRIERKAGQAGVWALLHMVSGNTVNYDDASVASGTTYYYRVCAYNANGASGYSNEATASPGGSGDVREVENNVAIQDMTAMKGMETYYKISVPAGASRLTIKTSGGTGDCDLYVRYGALPSRTAYDYRPYRSGNNETVAVTSPQAGDWYIMARGYRAYADVTMLAVYETGGGDTGELAAPSNLTAAAVSANQIDLSWSDNSTAETGFKIERRNAASSVWDDLGSTAANVASYQDTLVSGGVTYYYRVRAYHDNAFSAYSNIATATPDASIVTIENNVPVSGLAGVKKSEAHFKVVTPAGCAKLTITISGGTGDCDLYVKFGSQASRTSYNYRPYVVGNNEQVIVSNPSGGEWYIMLRAYSAYSGVTLKASY